MALPNESKVVMVPYLGRMIPKEHFCAFVYGPDKKIMLAKSYDEFNKLIASGLWFDTKQSAEKAKAKKKGD